MEALTSALDRVPTDVNGEPMYETVDAETAWDALVEQTEGDAETAQMVAEAMVDDKAKALEKAEKAKSKGGTTVTEKIAAEKERKANIAKAQQELDAWKAIASVQANRQTQAQAEAQEQARIEAEHLNGVPDMIDDTPEAARKRGYRSFNGYVYTRQEPVAHEEGKAVEIKFSDKEIVPGHVAIIDVANLQPSHITGNRNPLHFIDEAQPKERKDDASVFASRQIAANIRPEEVTSSITAYTGAPTVNTRGEVIQGNNRSEALRLMWESEKTQAQKYKQYLIDHATEFGLTAVQIESMEQPVLVNMVDVTDEQAINLGQYVAQDTESGGIERIKPKNAMSKMGDDMRIFANLLLRGADEDMSITALIDVFGEVVLDWMAQKGYITATQYQSAFDSRGNITAEAKNDLKGIMYQSIFKGAPTQLEEMFNALPAKAQKAILATAYRDFDSPKSESMIREIQNSISAFYYLMFDKAFAEAKNFEDARKAVELWKKQTQIDYASGDAYLPAEKFSNFALHLATMYKGNTQKLIQGTFNQMYDLIQGTQEETLFDKPDNTPRTLAEAIKEVLNIEYNGQFGSNVLGGNSTSSTAGRRGSAGNTQSGERSESAEQSADSAGSIDTVSEQSEVGSTPSLLDVVRTLYSKGKDVASKLFQRSFFDVAQTPKFMQELGLRGDKFTIKYGVIARHLGKDSSHTLTERDWEQLPQALQNPFAISKLTDKTDSYRIYTTLQTESGEFVVVGADVKNAGREIEVNAVSTVFGRRDNANLPKNEEVIYRSKEITPEQSSLLERPNFAQYPTEQELSDSEVTTSLGENKGIGEKVAEAEAEVNTTPTEKQKEAGNYKKGHVKIGSFDITIEQPKGSVRSGVDANGKKWETTMKNTYGYIRGTEGVDGDHIDVFLSDDIDGWNGSKVFVIDQYNEDGTFDEHKVMLGFNDIDEAYDAYLSNYSDGWADNRKIVIRPSEIDFFEKWLASSHRKTKPYNEYRNVQFAEKRAKKEANDVVSSAPIGYNPGSGKWNNVPGKWFTSKPDRFGEVTAWGRHDRIQLYSQDGVSGIRVFVRDNNAETPARIIDILEQGGFDIESHGEYGSFVEFDNYAEAEAFAEYVDQVQQDIDAKRQDIGVTHQARSAAPYSIAPAQYTTKRGKVLEMHLVRFSDNLTKEQQRAAKELAKANKGWYDREQGGFMMRSEEDARELAETILNNEDAVDDAQPVSLADAREVVENYKPNEEVTDWSRSNMVESVAQRLAKKAEFVGTLTQNNIDTALKPAINQSVVDELLNSYDVTQSGFLSFYKENIDNVTDRQEFVNDVVARVKEILSPKETSSPKNQGQFGLVSDERMAELKARLRNKLGQLNAGIDPEVLAIGLEIAVGHLDRGIKSFADFAKVMIEDLGDVVRPYLKAFYNGARDLPEVIDNGLADDMTSYEDVRTFDIANFGKSTVNAFATAQTVVAEQKHQEEAEQAKQEIIDNRNTQRKERDEQTTANTQIVASEAAFVASEATSSIKKARTEEEVNAIEQEVDEQLIAIDNQLSELDYIDNLHSGMRVITKDGSEILLNMVMHEGEQLGATQFSKPRVRKMYGFHEGQLVDIAPSDVDVAATIRLNEGSFEATKQREENPNSYNGYKIGDKVMYTPQSGSREPVQATIHDFEIYGDHKPVLDTGLAPVLYEVVEWSDIAPISEEKAEKAKKSSKKAVNSQQSDMQSLFDSIFDNQTETENGTEQRKDTRTDNSRTRLRSEELSETESVGTGTSVQGASRNSQSKRRRSDLGSGESGNGPQYDVNRDYTNEEIGEIVSSVTDIVDGKVVITGAVTDDIKAVCRQYRSGGVAKKGRGILDEYYTDGKIVDVVGMLIAPYFKGSKAVRVLEPSVGVGNFIAATRDIPTSEVVTFEINETTARIAKVLYPDIDVNLRSFETEFIDESGNKKPMPQKFSLVIGNPPYGSHRGLYKGLGEESKIARYEDYFVKRSLDVLEDGGVLAMVLPSSWIDRHTKFGGYTIEAAYRLPSGAFEATQVGTDIVVLRKDSSIPISEHIPYFEQHPERVLGEVKQRKGRFGKMEDYVEGNIDTAIEAIEREHAKGLAEQLNITPSNDNLNDIQSAIEETGSTEKAKAIVESEKSTKSKSVKESDASAESKPSKYKVELSRDAETVPTSNQFEHKFSDGEVEAFADTDYDGTITNPSRHRKYANYMGGRMVHDFYYAEGDIYTKLAQLERERDYIVETYGREQYDKQKRLLENVLPKRKGLDEITISPNTTFVKNLNIATEGGTTPLADLFTDFCCKLPYSAFGDSSLWEVIGYVNNEQVYGQDKERNQLIRERRKRVANDLFVKFLNEELSDSAKTQVVIAFNREYNSTYRPDYSKVPMFSTINKDFRGKPLKLTEVQLAGIGRMTVKGVGVLAHEVGFGKTLSGILAMHEAMTRGFASKPLIVVPNDNILKQWVETINEVLPSATVNMLGNLGTSYNLTDFKVNDGEFTIVTYEGLKAMSFSDDTYNRLADRFSYITEDLKKHQSERDIQKEIEKAKELKGKMKRGSKPSYGFEDFGFDWLTFDEVHNANHIVSKVRLDKSISSDFRSQSQRTSDLGLKTWLAAQYIQELKDGRNVLLLSATPFTNKPLEYYSILSLVANDMLLKKGFFNVDQFFATFMEADNELEVGANGRPVQKTNIRRFRNNGLFQQLLSEFIDIKGEEDNPDLVRPTRHNREYKIAQNELTEEAIAASQDLLSDNDTVLQGISHARAAAFSPYATSLLGIKPKNAREFVKNSPKIDAAIKLIEQNKKDRPDAGQIIYSEVGVEFFPLIRDYLVSESGFKAEEVRIITGATSNAERIKIQTAFNKGEVKVVIGSPAIKEGLNLQENTTDMYILSLPWNFTQLRQIEGRGWRQGNKWENIRINYLLTNDSVDVFMLQRLQLKQSLYNEAMKSGAESLDVSDIDTSELKTALITDPSVRAEIVTVQQKAKLYQEKTQIEADLSFVNRKYESYNKVIEKLNDKKNTIGIYRNYAKDGSEYWANVVKREEAALLKIEEEIQQEKEKLLKKGVNVDEIERQTKQAQDAIDAIQNKIDNLEEFQKELTEKYRQESEAKAAEMNDKLSDYLKERKAENNGGFYKIRPKEGVQSANAEEDEDVLYRLYGGNSGYVGYSMSKRAESAREEGRFPKTDFKKEYGVSDKVLQALVDARIVSDSEWHHTSKFGNKTVFYGWEEPWYADVYAEHKDEISKDVRQLGNKPSLEDYESTQEGMNAYGQDYDAYRAKVSTLRKKWEVLFESGREAYEARIAKEQEEREAQQKLLEEYHAFIAQSVNVPDEYEASNGVVVKTVGDGYDSYWTAYKGGEKLTKRNGKGARNAAFAELREKLHEERSKLPTFKEWQEQRISEEDAMYRSDDVDEIPNYKAKYGLKGVGPTAVIRNEDDLIKLKKIVDKKTHKALEGDFKAQHVYGSAYDNHNFIVIFRNKPNAPSYTSAWWHEAAHIAYRKLNLSNKEELGLHALEWLKKQGGKFRDHYYTVIDIYDKSLWATEATARMIQLTIKSYGIEQFLKNDFVGHDELSGKVSKLANAIRNQLIYGTEKPRESDKLRYSEYINRIHATDSGRVGEGNRISGNISSTQYRGQQRRSGENAEGDRRNVREVAERSGSGAVSDEAVTMASDPVSKAIGEPRYGRGRKMREYAQRERQRMVAKVQELCDKLHLDNVEIVTDASTLEGKKARAKGFYSPATGKITIVVPNHANVFDVAETVLHEAVAHYGLRKLFGEHFDEFIKNVYEAAEDEVRDKINALARNNGWDFRKATEEYLASLAEDTEFETIRDNPGWWYQVKRFFRDMLAKLGLTDFAKEGITLSDNELRYILWRSYQHLKGNARGIFAEAENAAKQYDLQVGNYAAPKVAESGEEGEYYRDGDFTPRDKVLARDYYEKVVSSGSYQFREAVQDSMLGLRRLYEAIDRDTKIEDVPGFENAYIYENRMSSTNARYI